jgi:FkbM family methyltransferase
MAMIDTWRHARGGSRKTVARLARRWLPRRTVNLTHLEPGLTLTVSLKRHLMFWSGGLARFEPATVRVLRAAVAPGDVVLDVGANIGFFTTLFSRWVGNAGRVLAIEPEPENQVLLTQNLQSNGCGNVTVCGCAVGAAAGIERFSTDEATGATGYLGDAVTAGEVAVGTGKVRVIETQVETIDALVERHAAAPAVVKLDIEGGELGALQGAVWTLSHHRPIIVSELTGRGGPAAVEFLECRDYRMWDLESGRVLGDGAHPFMVVAIPEEKLPETRARAVQEALTSGV